MTLASRRERKETPKAARSLLRFLLSCWPLLPLLLGAPRPCAEASVADALGLGSRAVSLGGAQTALADDFSATFYNPGGLAAAAGSNVTVGCVWAKPWLHWREKDGPEERADLLATGASYLGLTTHLSHLTGFPQLDPWTLGLCIYVPLERVLFTDIPPESSEKRFLFYLDNTQVLALLAGIGWKIAPWLSVGMSGHFLADLRAPNEAVAEIDLSTVLPYLAGLGDLQNRVRPRIMRDAELKVAPIAGIRVRPTEWLLLGLTYRGRLYGETVGTQDILLRFTDFSNPSSSSLQTAILADIHYVHYWKPNQISLGAAFLPGRLSVSLDLTWADWSDFVDSMWYRPSPPFRDTWTPRIGIEYRFGNGLAVRGGYAFQKSPVPEQTGSSNYMDCDRHILSCGAGYTFSRVPALILWKKPLTVDAYVQYIQLVERTYHKSDPVQYGKDITLGGRMIHGGLSFTLHY